MAGIINGQPVDAPNSNAAWIAKNGDDATVGKLGLLNVEVASGPTIPTANGIQRLLNAISSFVGVATSAVYNALPAWISTDAGAPTDDLHDRAEALTGKFNLATGHAHSGAAGDGVPISAPDLVDVPLVGRVIQGADLVGVTGLTKDVTFDLAGKPISSGPTVAGVVVTAPNNKVVLRQATGANQDDVYKDALGNIVYGRLTHAAGTWTLTFFVNLAGVETAYNFMGASDIRWYYQRLYSPFDAAFPVYSEFASIPSDNATADVLQATTAEYGKTILSGVAAANVGTAGAAGTANGTVANADHVHRGVHSIKKTGDTALYGDTELEGGTNVTLTQVGQKITIASTASGGGGGSLQWIEGNVPAPAPRTTDDGDLVYDFAAGDDQSLFASIRVPNSYVAGSPIRIRALTFSPSVANNVQMRTDATLIRTGVDPITDTTNQRTSTNAAYTNPATANVPQSVLFDLTNGAGQINGVAVSPNDLIRARLYRDADTDPADVSVLVYSSEVTFS